MDIGWYPLFNQGNEYFIYLLEEFQSKKCGICGREGNLVLDHDHESNYARGLVCPTCNSNLGVYDRDYAKINPKWEGDYGRQVFFYINDPPVEKLLRLIIEEMKATDFLRNLNNAVTASQIVNILIKDNFSKSLEEVRQKDKYRRKEPFTQFLGVSQ